MPGTFNSLIDRNDAAALIPAEEAAEILQIVPQSSAALSLCRQVRMSTKTLTQPVLASFPVAYWVNGDTGIKQTTDLSWGGVSMVAEELAAIVVIPDNVVADSGYPLWAEIRPWLAEAIGLALDQAVFMGTNKPATWPTALVPAAIAAGQTAELDSTPEQGGATNDLLEIFDDVEGAGYNVSGIAAGIGLKGALRRSRDTSGQKLLDVSTNSIEGVGIEYVGFNVFDAATKALGGDFSMAMIGVRQDLSWKMLDQAVITDDTGAVIVNLPQQDSQALRVTARFGFAVANPKTHSPEATPYPFAVLQDTVVGP
jgi:HK97 family phage major capsid protein